MSLIGTWVDGVPDDVVVALVECDVNGVDLDDTNATRRFAARNRLVKLLGHMSRSKEKYREYVAAFKAEMNPRDVDERDELVASIRKHIERPPAKTG